MDALQQIREMGTPCSRAVVPLMKQYMEYMGSLRAERESGRLPKKEAAKSEALESWLEADGIPMFLETLRMLPDGAAKKARDFDTRYGVMLADASRTVSEDMDLMFAIPGQFKLEMRKFLPIAQAADPVQAIRDMGTKCAMAVLPLAERYRSYVLELRMVRGTRAMYGRDAAASKVLDAWLESDGIPMALRTLEALPDEAAEKVQGFVACYVNMLAEAYGSIPSLIDMLFAIPGQFRKDMQSFMKTDVNGREKEREMIDIILETGRIGSPCAGAALPLVRAYMDRLGALRGKLRANNLSPDDAFAMGYLEAGLQREAWPAFIGALKALPGAAVDRVAAETGALMGELASIGNRPDAEAISLLQEIPERFMGAVKEFLPDTATGDGEGRE